MLASTRNVKEILKIFHRKWNYEELFSSKQKKKHLLNYGGLPWDRENIR